MLKDAVSLQSSLLALETVLRVDYEEKDVRKLIAKSRRQLSDAYGRDMTVDTIYEIMRKSMLSSDGLEVLLARILEPVKDLAFLTSVCLFKHKFPVSLSAINYLGSSSEKLRHALKRLQSERLYETRHGDMEPLKDGVNRIEFCEEKRVLVLMLLLESLGIQEAVFVLAQLLYMGGLEL